MPDKPAPKTKDKDSFPLSLKWERRKKVGYAPSVRSGCTMALWQNKGALDLVRVRARVSKFSLIIGMGLLFGGVTDEDTSEEGLESVFWNDLYVV